MDNYILEMKNISKIYGNGIVANRDVNFKLKKGEIHALVGENGAGKSTLMKILFGMEAPSSGEIVLRGEPLRFSSSKDAIAHGIGMVHQHFMLVESFTAAQNIVLGMEPKRGLFIDKKRVQEIAYELSKKYNLDVDINAITGRLPVGIKQKIEILKSLARGAEILILDEPTAVLTPQETEQLFMELEELRNQGHTIVFISHKIPEIKRICDRITIMRNGELVGEYDTDELEENDISNLIMGSNLDTSIERVRLPKGEIRICVKDLSYTDPSGIDILKNISFSAHSGEIFGIAGVQGNGQVELIELLTKRRHLKAGKIEIDGKDLKDISIQDLRKSDFGYIPEDRIEQGMGGQETISENMISNRYYTSEFSKNGMLKERDINNFAEKNIEEYEIKCSGPKDKAAMLSGGNMQKVVVARECGHDPRVLIAEQPTRGVDIGAAYTIHKKLIELKKKGCAVLLVSADLSEVLKLSDKLAVLYDGSIVAYFDSVEGLSEEKLGLYMLGIEKHDKEQIRRAEE